MSEGTDALVAEYAEIERQLADPTTHANMALARRLGRRYSQLTPIVKALAEHRRLNDDLAAAQELAAEDPSFVAEVESLQQQVSEATERLTHDFCDAIVEIKSGEGGEESALFAADLFRMYARYAENRGWKVEVLDTQDTDLGGYKSVTALVRAPGQEEQMPYGVLRFEGGVHRVQRVPVTESQGRIHTSAAGVLVTPDLDDTSEIEINDEDVYRSSGKGGQGVNTTDSAVRITHLPSGIVVSCQNERSQLQNKESAMRVLRARLAAAAAEEAANAAAAARKSQVRTVDRSERIRTYNFPENRIADHRIGFKAHNLDLVLAGELQPLLTALHEADLAERLARVGES